MSRRRRSRRAAASGMLSGVRKNIKKVGGAAVGIVGLSIALAPVVAGVNAATGSGTNLTTASLGQILPTIQSQYGVNPSTGTVDFGIMLPKIIFPIIGAYVFVKGVRVALRAV